MKLIPHYDTLLYLIFAGLIALAALANTYRDWQFQKYAEAHHCVTIGTKSAEWGLDVDSRPHFVPPQTIYQCDNEIQIH